jgi:hypothetical protein
MNVYVTTFAHNNGDYAGPFGNLLNHGEDEVVNDAATLGYLSGATRVIVSGANVFEVANALVESEYAAQPRTVRNQIEPSRFAVATAARRWSEMSCYVQATDNEKIVWIDLSSLSVADRITLVAILNRTERFEGYGVLSDADLDALDARRAAAAADPGDPEVGCDGRGNFEPRSTPRSMTEVLALFADAGDVPAFQRGLPIELD